MLSSPQYFVKYCLIFREVLFNISRSTIIGCKAKYEVTKKRDHQDFRVLKIKVFGQKGSISDEVQRMTKRRSSEIFGR